MSENSASAFVSRLAALSQPTRLKVIEVIAQGGDEGIAAGKIAQALRCPASTLSFHLKELTQAGLLEATPDGRFIRYSVKPDTFAGLAAYIAHLPARPATAQTAAPARKGAGKRPAARKSRRASGESEESAQENQLSIFGD
jgi:DNA-binding transcriptional ArsR family regulator